MISSFDSRITLQFVREAALSSDLIAWFSHGGGFSHVDAVGPRGELWGARSDRVRGRFMDIPPGFQIRPPNYHNFVHKVIFEIPCSREQRLAFWKFLNEQIGKPYDSKAIWSFAFDRDWRSPDSWVCSEAMMAALENSTICPHLYVPVWRITPRDVALIVSAIGGKVASPKGQTAWQTELAGPDNIAYAPKNCAA